MAMTAEARNGAASNAKVNFELARIDGRKTTDSQMRIVDRLIQGERPKDVAASLSVSPAYVSKVAALFGMSRASVSCVPRAANDGFSLLVSGRRFLIDADVAPIAGRHKWSLHRGEYASCRALGLLHRWVMDAKPGEIVDHIDGNALNCRRDNLRLVSANENLMNRSAFSHGPTMFKGVAWHPSGRWRATITKGGKRHSLGYFAHPINAAVAYDNAARQIFGTFARVNFPESGEQSAIWQCNEAALLELIQKIDGGAHQ